MQLKSLDRDLFKILIISKNDWLRTIDIPRILQIILNNWQEVDYQIVNSNAADYQFTEMLIE